MAARLGEAPVALPQLDAAARREIAQLVQRAVHQPRVGRVRHRLGLHRGVDHDALQVLGRDRAALVRHVEALLEQRLELGLAQPLAPARQRRAVERQPVAEAHLAAEILEIGVLHPARAQRLVGQAVHVLEDHQPGDQPSRQRRLPGTGAAHTGEAAVEEAPVDPLRQSHQRMPHVDDPVERRAKQVRLPIIPRLGHGPSLPQAGQRRESRFAKTGNRKRRKSTPLPPIPANRVTATDSKPNLDQWLPGYSRTTRWLRGEDLNL